MQHLIKAAIALKDFDTTGARIPISPLGRIPIRPASQQGAPRRGAVLIPFFETENRLHVVLIKRRDDLRYHPGQISFPGGRLEKNEEPLDCALRETREETGIAPESLTIVGHLEPAYILASDFNVYPFAGLHSGVPVCRPDPGEVDDIFFAPLASLNTPEAISYEYKNILGTQKKVPGFSFLDYHIWGATAMLLNEIIQRLTKAGWRE